MKAYSQLSSRRAQCLYHQALQRQQLTHAPHFNVVSKTLNNPEMTKILHEFVCQSALPLTTIETNFAVDSSGFRCSSFGSYCERKHGTKRMHNWIKVHICTGVKTNIVTDVVITEENVGDSPQFQTLIKKTAEGFSVDDVVADKAYSSRENHEIVKKYGGTAFIPFKENATGNARGSKLWNKAYHFFQYHINEFDEHYHKRSNAESTFSAIKKKFGETIKSKNKIARENEMLCKIIAYNLTVLIHEMIELDGISDFLCFDGLKEEVTLKSTNGFGNHKV
jgi:transposase